MRRFMSMTALALGMAFAVACSDDDEPTTPAAETFRAALTGAAERPTPRTTPATGTADFSFRRDTLRWTITMSNITNVTAAHIHKGGAEESGGVLLGLTPGTSGVSNSRIEGFATRAQYTAPSSPNQGVTFDSLLTLMRAGNAVYVNVHTNNTANDPTNNSGPGDFPAGEIRGTVARTP